MKIIRILAVAALTALGGASVRAENYPTKPVKIIVSTSPAGITDILARILGQYITAKTGQPHVIDNRAGASGNIAMDAVAKAPADGYTLGFANTGNITVNPYLFTHMTFDPLTDLVPVGAVGTVPLFLVMNPTVPANNLKEFIAYAKANPDKVSYAAAGAGTTPDLTGGEFARRAGLDKLVFVPFRGTAPAATAVLQGVAQITFVSLGPSLQNVESGKLRVLAAATPQADALCERYPDLLRGRIPRLRNVDLVLAVRAQRHAEGDRRAAQWLYPRRTERSRDEETSRRPVRRSTDPDAAGIRRSGEGGRGQMGAPRPRSRDQARIKHSTSRTGLAVDLPIIAGFGYGLRPRRRG